MARRNRPLRPAPRPIHRVAQELAESSGFLLARLGMGFKARAIARLEQAGFEIYDYSVLAILAEGARETQATIADALTLDPSRLVALLDSLEQRGLIVRQRDPQDRRRQSVSITAAGKRELSRLRAISAARGRVLRSPRRGGPQGSHELLLRLAAQNDPRCAFSSDGFPSAETAGPPNVA